MGAEVQGQCGQNREISISKTKKKRNNIGKKKKEKEQLEVYSSHPRLNTLLSSSSSWEYSAQRPHSTLHPELPAACPGLDASPTPATPAACSEWDGKTGQAFLRTLTH